MTRWLERLVRVDEYKPVLNLPFVKMGYWEIAYYLGGDQQSTDSADILPPMRWPTPTPSPLPPKPVGPSSRLVPEGTLPARDRADASLAPTHGDA